jgi:nucleoside diphosphate kinase
VSSRVHEQACSLQTLSNPLFSVSLQIIFSSSLAAALLLRSSSPSTTRSISGATSWGPLTAATRPNSIRALYGMDTTRNATHSCDS